MPTQKRWKEAAKRTNRAFRLAHEQAYRGRGKSRRAHESQSLSLGSRIHVLESETLDMRVRVAKVVTAKLGLVTVRE